MATEGFKAASEGWFSLEGPEDDVVVSSSITLSRNVEGVPFSGRMGSRESDSLLESVYGAVKDLTGSGYSYYDINSLKIAERQILAERGYLKPVIAFERPQTILIKEDEEAAAVFNGAEHLSIKSIKSGLAFRDAYNCCNALDNFFDERLNFAFSPEIGYLTSDLTTAGTGMTGSVMLFLPGARRLGKIEEMLTKIIRMGFQVRGFFEDSKSKDESFSLGDGYIINNQFSSGKSEEQFIECLEEAANNAVRFERDCRDFLIRRERLKIEDEIFRAKGILQNNRTITAAEAIQHLSAFKLGKYYNLTGNDITYSTLNCLLLKIQKYHIKNSNRESGLLDEDAARAKYIRNILFPKDYFFKGFFNV